MTGYGRQVDDEHGRWTAGRTQGVRRLLALIAATVVPAVLLGGAAVAVPVGMAVPAGTAVVRGAPPAAGPTPVAGPVGGTFRWPVGGVPRLGRGFAPPPEPWLPGHRGVDLIAPAGTPVLAAGDGVVLFAGRVAGRGVVSVSHAGGLRTTYEPVAAEVVAGDRVGAGDRLGRLAPGHSGCPEAACLHWGLRRGETYLDPLALLGPRRVSLLPLGR